MRSVTERVWEEMQRHVGKASGMTCERIAECVKASEREVRFAVSELREAGVALCGHPTSGYFIAHTQEELNETCRFLRSRAIHSLELEARLRNLSLTELVGEVRGSLNSAPKTQEESCAS